jgi:hypothetical protein
MHRPITSLDTSETPQSLGPLQSHHHCPPKQQFIHLLTYQTIHLPQQYKMPPFWTIGTLFGASSVMIGAFGAHGLKQRIADPARIANWGTAAQYQVCFPLPFFSLLLLLIVSLFPPLRRFRQYPSLRPPTSQDPTSILCMVIVMNLVLTPNSSSTPQS